MSRLVDAGADVVCLVRDWVPQSELVGGESARPRQGRRAATSATRRCSSACLGEYEIDTVIHLAAQTIVGVANRNPGLDVRDQHRRDLAAARGVPPQPGGQADRRRLVRQGLRRAGEAALRRGHAARGPASLRRQQVVRRPDRQTLRGHLRPAGRDHPLRQLLRRRRPELEPASCPARSARVLRGERPVIRSDGTFVRDYFYVEDGAAAYIAPGRGAGAARRPCRRGVQLLERDASSPCSSCVDEDPGRRWARRSSRTSATRRAHEIRDQYLERREGARRCSAGGRCSRLDEGLDANHRLVPRLPRRDA